MARVRQPERVKEWAMLGLRERCQLIAEDSGL